MIPARRVARLMMACCASSSQASSHAPSMRPRNASAVRARGSLRSKHLGLDPCAYLREALPGLFALGGKPTAQQLSDGSRISGVAAERDTPIPVATPGEPPRSTHSDPADRPRSVRCFCSPACNAFAVVAEFELQGFNPLGNLGGISVAKFPCGSRVEQPGPDERDQIANSRASTGSAGGFRGSSALQDRFRRSDGPLRSYRAAGPPGVVLTDAYTSTWCAIASSSVVYARCGRDAG